MSLGWKDAGSTLLTAGAVTLAIVAIRDWASFVTVRWALVGMMLLGVGACAVGAYGGTDLPPLYSVGMGILVAGAIVTLLLGLIFGGKSYLVAMAVIIGLLWLITTIRHAFA